MDAFATVADLEARWRVLDESEKLRAEVLLDDASVRITTAWKKVQIEPDEDLKLSAKAVVCAMVSRVMSASADLYGATQASMTAGPFSQSTSFGSTGLGNMFMTKEEKQELGIGSQKVHFATAKIQGKEIEDGD